MTKRYDITLTNLFLINLFSHFYLTTKIRIKRFTSTVK